MEDRPDRRLGGAAEAHDVDFCSKRPDAVGQADRDPVAREHRQPERAGQRLPASLQIVDQHLHQSGDGIPQGDPVRGHQLRPARRLAQARRRGQDDGAARGEQAEEVVDRQVEVERGEGEDPVLRPHAEPAVDVEDGVERRAMLDRDTFGEPRRAGGEDHVGEVVRPLHGGRRRVVRRVLPVREALAVERQQDDPLGPVERFREAALGQGEPGLAVLQEEAEPLPRDVRIDR